jgi:NADH dehydrogenase|tara:strand:- start:147 stop:458 length:312 start_codon:yes stop_codon:yes gene_type:complete
MRARIYKPSKTAMSSGLAKTKSWVLEFIQETTSEIDPLMGWTSSGDTQSQVTLKFESKQAAIDYAREHGIDAQISEPKQRKFNIRSGGYGENFATNRRGAWTH